MIKKIAHIAIAVQDLHESLKYYTEILGLACLALEDVPDQMVRVAILPIGDTRIELVESISEESPIAKFIAKRGEGLHHIAFTVGNIQAALSHLEGKKIKLIDSTPRAGADGNQVAFLHPDSTQGVLTEICE